MGRQQDRFIIILDIDRMFSTDDLAWVKQDEAAEGGPRHGSICPERSPDSRKASRRLEHDRGNAI
jgi:hypothetical protein